MTNITAPMTQDADDFITIFQLDEQPVRGRSISLGEQLDKAIAKRYPDTVARLLGEAMLIGALVAQSLKFKGRLVVQCHGTNKGAVSLLIADCTSDGAIRGYARWDEEALKETLLGNRSPGANTLLGGGTFSMTIDQGPDMDQYQGLAAIEGSRLSDCAEHYFAQSEQIPTEIRLACGQTIDENGPHWRGGGMMIQKIAGDAARGDTDESWTNARSLFGTLTDAELIDPDLAQNTLLYRLFHEDGVRVISTHDVKAQCSCSRDRLYKTLKSFDKNALIDMAEDGKITANCEFCATDYVFELADMTSD
ncbi:MAG: Hsp33 family molecular chaperone HslO [Litorimonas sp.]